MKLLSKRRELAQRGMLRCILRTGMSFRIMKRLWINYPDLAAVIVATLNPVKMIIN
jgi:hypothetical protein